MNGLTSDMDGETLEAVMRVRNIAYLFVHAPDLLLEAGNKERNAEHGQESKVD